jgi:hydroxymethylpyrimidine/phosphomethylpyrimidine kinase
MSAHGVYAASVLTSVTAQNTVEVRAAYELSPDLVRAQLEAVFDDMDISAVKTGMLYSAPAIKTVALMLAGREPPLVIDPVLISHSGQDLLQEGAAQTLTEKLFPLALVVTPNINEASFFSGRTIESLEDVRAAARVLADMGPRAVLIKGGHAGFSRGTDVLLYDGRFHEFAAEKVYEKDVHGTGCTFSAALTARLALGETVIESVKKAKAYTAQVISHRVHVGRGHNPGNHFYFIKPVDFSGD